MKILSQLLSDQMVGGTIVREKSVISDKTQRILGCLDAWRRVQPSAFQKLRLPIVYCNCTLGTFQHASEVKRTPKRGKTESYRDYVAAKSKLWSDSWFE